MLKKIIISIILGGLFGFISHIIIGSRLYLPEDMLFFSMFLGVIFGLLICLIVDVNKLIGINSTGA